MERDPEIDVRNYFDESNRLILRTFPDPLMDRFFFFFLFDRFFRNRFFEFFSLSSSSSSKKNPSLPFLLKKKKKTPPQIYDHIFFSPAHLSFIPSYLLDKQQIVTDKNKWNGTYV